MVPDRQNFHGRSRILFPDRRIRCAICLRVLLPALLAIGSGACVAPASPASCEEEILQWGERLGLHTEVHQNLPPGTASVVDHARRLVRENDARILVIHDEGRAHVIAPFLSYAASRSLSQRAGELSPEAGLCLIARELGEGARARLAFRRQLLATSIGALALALLWMVRVLRRRTEAPRPDPRAG